MTSVWGLPEQSPLAAQAAAVEQMSVAVHDHLDAIATWQALGNAALVGAHRAALRMVLRALDREERESVHWSESAA